MEKEEIITKLEEIMAKMKEEADAAYRRSKESRAPDSYREENSGFERGMLMGLSLLQNDLYAKLKPKEAKNIVSS